MKKIILFIFFIIGMNSINACSAENNKKNTENFDSNSIDKKLENSNINTAYEAVYYLEAPALKYGNKLKELEVSFDDLIKKISDSEYSNFLLNESPDINTKYIVFNPKGKKNILILLMKNIDSKKIIRLENSFTYEDSYQVSDYDKRKITFLVNIFIKDNVRSNEFVNKLIDDHRVNVNNKNYEFAPNLVTTRKKVDNIWYELDTYHNMNSFYIYIVK